MGESGPVVGQLGCGDRGPLHEVRKIWAKGAGGLRAAHIVAVAAMLLKISLTNQSGSGQGRGRRQLTVPPFAKGAWRLGHDQKTHMGMLCAAILSALAAID